ncbi:nickel transport system substrate-binding protein [Neokomagataea thailandica NBRC 106555]|uniref:DUF4198 domain-containing protein n=2 Tax=Neokomagataea TaxID=1223423 RepID=A0A4Y6V300_9PROT|nr:MULTISPECIES: DUF4198 domain-containing protein [Neokomagataea]QDH24363.1 DUF4198 domain-containing protein [Neokomagataea tanensis]GBR53274.1 nickel transport system substrate-binding protein [Neokomagataea thailandica NBRC 106555]
MRLISRLSLILFFLFVGAPPLLASSAFVVLERLGKPTIVMTEVSSDEAYNPSVLTRLSAYTPHGIPIALLHHEDTQHITLDKQPNAAAIIVQANFGFHARLPKDDHWTWQRKTLLKGATIGLQAIKESVNLYISSPLNLKAHGLHVEIIPLVDPLNLHRGDRLPLQVLLEGKPLPNVRVNENFLNSLSEVTKPTDNEGRTSAYIHADQVNVLQITYEQPLQHDPDADFIRYNSALTFHAAQ